MNVRVWLEVELTNKRNELLFRNKQPIRSFLYNWTKALYGLAYGACTTRVVELVDTDGILRKYPSLYSQSYPVFSFRAGAGNTNYGILFGNGTKSVELSDYCLDSKIGHGTSAGQLSYQDTILEHSSASDRSYLIVSRSADNVSGGDITVSEVGLAFNERDADAGSLFFLILRDILDPAMTVANTQTITARYVFEFLL